MRETLPTVRLLAEPRIHWPVVEDAMLEFGGTRWLDRVNPTRESPIASDAELLIEYGGRRCYRSWDVGLNANVTRTRNDTVLYLRNLLRSGHGAVLEHAQFTFDFADVSRVFTHELVRHRAGVAISQESLRYVRLTDLGVRIPKILEDGPPIGGVPFKTHVVHIVERLEEFQREAADAFGLDNDDVPFHVKKEVTSALRRLAPIGLSTGMVWSANARTLRHVIALRTDPTAEEEIRLVFHEVGRIMRERFPLLFGDFIETTVSDSDVPALLPEFTNV